MDDTISTIKHSMANFTRVMSEIVEDSHFISSTVNSETGEYDVDAIRFALVKVAYLVMSFTGIMKVLVEAGGSLKGLSQFKDDKDMNEYLDKHREMLIKSLNNKSEKEG
jgi:hypothetical protein